MFLMKYAISVKREEMRKLEKLAREEEQKLLIAEQAKLTITLNCTLNKRKNLKILKMPKNIS